MCIPPPPFVFFWWTSYQFFKRGGGELYKTLILEGVGGKGGMTFLRGKLQFLQEK